MKWINFWKLIEEINECNAGFHSIPTLNLAANALAAGNQLKSMPRFQFRQHSFFFSSLVFWMSEEKLTQKDIITVILGEMGYNGKLMPERRNETKILICWLMN